MPSGGKRKGAGRPKGSRNVRPNLCPHCGGDLNYREGCSCEAQILENKYRPQYKSVYGLDRTTYNNLLKSQDYRCAICERPAFLVVDHDHTTGRVRGLLCSPCNLGLGFYERIGSAVKKLGAYVTSHYDDISNSSQETKPPQLEARLSLGGRRPNLPDLSYLLSKKG